MISLQWRSTIDLIANFRLPIADCDSSNNWQSAINRRYEKNKLGMKFIVIFGPPAVGKMSVGRELAKLTGFKLFHNHMTIELALNFFEFGHPSFGRLIGEFRRRVLRKLPRANCQD